MKEIFAKEYGADRAILFSTGMSAVIMTLLAFLKKDGHVIFTADCYRQTRDFATNFLARFGLQTTLVDPSAQAVEKALQPNTNIIFTESPTNPYLRVLDIGCGDGEKALALVDCFKDKSKLRYCPIDVSEFMVKNAIGITALAEGVTCLIAVIGYIVLGRTIDFTLSMMLSIGAAFSAPISVLINTKAIGMFLILQYTLIPYSFIIFVSIKSIVKIYFS
jgi:hypothetical protein